MANKKRSLKRKTDSPKGSVAKKPNLQVTPLAAGKQMKNVETPSTSTSSEKSSTPRRKQSNPVRKIPYTTMLIHGKSFKLSLKILREIKTLTTSTKLLIPKAAFARLVRELLGEYGPQMRVQFSTLQALQEATEMYMCQFFEDSNLCAMHDKRVTLFCKDMNLIQTLRANNNNRI